ncbi:MAG: ORF6N domain-containing protein [Fidelibacterota bacterium]
MENAEKITVVHDPLQIREKIFTIRGVHVMLDRDLASLYKVETRVLIQAVKRNIARFPKTFCFQLTDEEFTLWKSQVVMSKEDKKGLRRPPYAFTEQGVAMLSAVLRSEIAIKVSVQIMNAFVLMRRFLISNARVFERLDTLELKQLQTKRKIEQVLEAIDRKQIQPAQGVFFDGQIFDAYKFVSNLVRKAKKSILLIDNYIDETVLDLFSKKRKQVKVTILTANITRALRRDVERFNAQYPTLELKEFTRSHDRFLIIDNKEIYHFGASLKDLGNKWFAFSKLDQSAFTLLENLKKVMADE